MFEVKREPSALPHIIIAIRPVRWRLLLSAPLEGPANMALDHALMARARQTGEAVLRVYGWAAPVLSLGRNQRAVGVYDDAELLRRGIAVVRRPTGGRALLHHREITYSVTAPSESAAGLSDTYEQINSLLVSALARLGVDASIARPATQAARPDGQPCFAEPARGEIVVGRRKLVGSAQWRDGEAFLQHGSIIVEDDQSLIPALMRSPADQPPPPATLSHLLGRTPSAVEVAGALFATVRATWDSSATELAERDVHLSELPDLIEHYCDAEWTWRR